MNQHAKLLRAATSSSGNGTADSLPHSYQDTWLSRLRQRLYKVEDLSVAGREVKGWVVPQAIGLLLLGAILSCGAYFYHEMSWQHDQLVRLSTQKEDAEKAADREHNDRALQASADQAWREKLNNQMSDLRNDFKNLQVQTRGRQ